MVEFEKQILKFWEKSGAAKPPGSLATHKDINQVSIEISIVQRLLSKKNTLLDVGCGNGFATSIYAKISSKTIGMDYSKNMINSAKKAYRNRKLDFEVGDVMSLNYKRGEFDTILSTRCLINLTDWNKQRLAIENIHRILNKGGRFILIEGIKQGRDNLNKLRVKLGLPVMPSVWHNMDFNENKLVPFLEGLFVIKQDIRLGLYDILTRVVYPATIYPRQPSYATHNHEIAEKLFYLFNYDLFRVYSREACFVLIKK